MARSYWRIKKGTLAQFTLKRDENGSPLYGPLHFDKGVFAAAEQHQTLRVMTVYFDKVGVQLDPATKRAFGSG
jgi:hypothetical protein